MSHPIVEALTAERQSQSLSMREVARLVGVSPSCVHSWEHGYRTPTVENLDLWARSLGYRVILTRPLSPASPKGASDG